MRMLMVLLLGFAVKQCQHSLHQTAMVTPFASLHSNQKGLLVQHLSTLDLLVNIESYNNIRIVQYFDRKFVFIHWSVQEFMMHCTICLKFGKEYSYC